MSNVVAGNLFVVLYAQLDYPVPQSLFPHSPLPQLCYNIYL